MLTDAQTRCVGDLREGLHFLHLHLLAVYKEHRMGILHVIIYISVSKTPPLHEAQMQLTYIT